MGHRGHLHPYKQATADGHWSADRRGAFTRGYANGWYDAHHGVAQMDLPHKADLFVAHALPIIGSQSET